MPLPLVHDEQGHPCRSAQELIDRWAEFFGAMEGGTRMDHQNLRDTWRSNLQFFIPDELKLTGRDLPTLVDLEIAYRRVRPGKAIGADKIPPELCHQHPTALARLTYTQMLKLLAHGQEALVHKGGKLVTAWKRKGAQSSCSSYRSLLISSHVGKTLHRAIREGQACLYETFLQSNQIGGRKLVPVGLGVHHARAALRIAKARGFSSALIFLDLQEAFYRVIRQIAVGGAIPDEILARIAHRLHLAPDALHELHAVLQEPSATAAAGLPTHYQNALKALHTDTHFWVEGQQDFVHTAVGTRPGDPFADVIFGFMFGKILHKLEAKMEEADLLDTYVDYGHRGLFPPTSSNPTGHVPMLGPTWMDDLCITLSGHTALALESKVGVACGILLDVCAQHGVTPNLSKGKTEILLAFKGPGSRKLKQRYFAPGTARTFPVVTEYGLQHLSVVGSYCHLGGLIHHNGDSRMEMRRRLAQGHAAFTEHRRALFQNPDLALIKRKELFRTLIVSKITYGMESWLISDLASKQLFHCGYLRLYRRLLRLPHDAHFSDEDLIVQADLPHPTTVLRIARLRYLALIYKCEYTTPWALFQQDQEWITQLRDDLQWLWELIRSTSTLPDPQHSFGPWENLLRYHRAYWKSLLLRAVHLEQLHHADRAQLRKLHRDVFTFLREKGELAIAPHTYLPAPQQAEEAFGCMTCQLRCKSRGGEGAHLFKVHGIVSSLRWLYDTTGCPHCLKEYHTFAKLQQHLRHSHVCRQALQGHRRHPCPAPGRGSQANEILHAQHDGLAPPLQAQGPHNLGPPIGPDQHYHLDLYEALATTCFDHQDSPDQDLFGVLRARIQEFAVGWTQTRITLQHLIDTITEEHAQLAQIDLAKWKQILARLADYRQWPFLCRHTQETTPEQNLTIDQFEDWCRKLTNHPAPRRLHAHIPRPRFVERVIVHAYSGRRRPGDLQWFLDVMAEKHGYQLHVVSLDLVIDADWGDIGKPDTYAFWIHAIKTGYVLGFLSGPPCCTWSAARGKCDDSMIRVGRQGPRAVRSAAELWGFTSLSLREKRQVFDGHKLLAFSIVAMVLLDQVDGAGALEHPSEPRDPEAASIWKLPLIEFILSLPNFEKVVFAQGLLGAKSVKSTTLLTLNLPELPKELCRHAVCKDLPKGRSIGLDADGQFQTAVLKEYPPALCSALAASFSGFILHDISSAIERHHLPADVKTRIMSMVSTDFGHAIGPDYAAG